MSTHSGLIDGLNKTSKGFHFTRSHGAGGGQPLRFVTTDEVSSKKLTGRHAVKIIGVEIKERQDNPPYLKVRYGEAMNKWQTSHQYFDGYACAPLLDAVDVEDITDVTAHERLMGRELGIELGVRRGSNGRDYVTVTAHHRSGYANLNGQH